MSCNCTNKVFKIRMIKAITFADWTGADAARLEPGDVIEATDENSVEYITAWGEIYKSEAERVS